MIISFVATLAAAAGLHRLIRLDDGRPDRPLGRPRDEHLPDRVHAGRALLGGAVPGIHGLVVRGRARGALAGRGLPSPSSPVSRASRARSSCPRSSSSTGWPSGGSVGTRRGSCWPPAARSIYLAINAVTFGDPFYFLEVQRAVFKVTTVAPWTALGERVERRPGPRAEPGLGDRLPGAVRWPSVVLAGDDALDHRLGKRSRPSYAVYTGLDAAELPDIELADQRAALSHGRLPDLHRRGRSRPAAVARGAAVRGVGRCCSGCAPRCS